MVKLSFLCIYLIFFTLKMCCFFFVCFFLAAVISFVLSYSQNVKIRTINYSGGQIRVQTRRETLDWDG